MKKLLLAALLLAAAPALAQEQAPAADWMTYKNPYTAKTEDLATAHRTADEVLSWSSQAVANALSFPATGFNDYVRGLKPMFLETGWAGYAAHLKSSGLADAARGGQYSVTTVALGDPRILRSGAAGGAWRWEVAVPVLTSLTQPDETGQPRTASSTRTEINLLLTHVAEDPRGAKDGLAIEGWTAQPLKK